MMRTRKDISVALAGGLGAYGLRDVLGAGPASLLAVVVAALLGAALDRVTGIT